VKAAPAQVSSAGPEGAAATSDFVVSGILYNTSQHGFEHAKPHSVISRASSHSSGDDHAASLADLHIEQGNDGASDKHTAGHGHGSHTGGRKPIHAVIFDLDGTLLDTESVSAQVSEFGNHR
jgi:hypothetical protein